MSHLDQPMLASHEFMTSLRLTLLSPLFFFLILRPPPTSTLFPYTTLFRSHLVPVVLGDFHLGDVGRAELQRSEEHTSELQSRFDLVCRLLLEKKNRAIT